MEQQQQQQQSQQTATTPTATEGSTAIAVEDLYDWGIENRLDQYYQPNGYPAPPQTHYEHYSSVHPSQQHQYPTPQIHPGRYESPESPQVKTERFYEQQALSPGASPRKRIVPHFDLDANEIMKVERKRARNRVAASKCRLRKLERIATLDQQASQLRKDNEELAALADKFRAQIYQLKQELRWHVNNGCKVWDRTNQAASPDSTTTFVSSCEAEKPSEKSVIKCERQRNTDFL